MIVVRTICPNGMGRFCSIDEKAKTPELANHLSNIIHLTMGLDGCSRIKQETDSAGRMVREKFLPDHCVEKMKRYHVILDRTAIEKRCKNIQNRPSANDQFFTDEEINQLKSYGLVHFRAFHDHGNYIAMYRRTGFQNIRYFDLNRAIDKSKLIMTFDNEEMAMFWKMTFVP